ncbi:uncharacterized protein [Dermacentor andersoni]|uniref:uncharacterized protein n=1 Tax=Dermacentor andersoni TaxID=34620 RepID=UPI003B3B33A1
MPHRSGIENLEQLTSTDLKQAWGKLKSMSLYELRRTRDLCHVQGAPRLRLVRQQEAYINTQDYCCCSEQHACTAQQRAVLISMPRITGSKCHSLYRFLPNEECTWDHKITKYLTKIFKVNNDTRNGKSCERPATEEYTRKTGNEVTALGFVINPVVPWLGFSPYGVVFKNGQLSVLLEVKSPVRGKQAKICELIKDNKLPYIISDKENFSLRLTQSYFSQVQIGLLLLNLKEAHFIVYSHCLQRISSDLCKKRRPIH